MKATLFAVVLSLFVVPFVTNAGAEPEPLNAGAEAAVSAQQTNKINLNKADVETLTQSFKGIGRKRAEAIIAYREANGGFKSIDDLGLVKGIGKQFITKNLDKLQETYSIE